MDLATHTWGNGERTAVLIHGLYNMGTVWMTTAAMLVEEGYRVVAVDLPGHGLSPRAAEYSQKLLAESVLAAVPPAPDLVVGHSLGGYTARLIAPELRPRTVVYADPAFSIVAATPELRAERHTLFRSWLRLTEEGVRRDNPRWSDADVHNELLGRDLFDPAFLDIMLDEDYLSLPDHTGIPELVLCASEGSVVPGRILGVEASSSVDVRTLPDTGHSLNRDDPAAFNAAVRDWAREHAR